MKQFATLLAILFLAPLTSTLAQSQASASASAKLHVAKGKGIPPFLILHVADQPDVSEQAERLEAVLKDAGIPAKRFAAKETNHSKLNENLGLPDDPPTTALFEFVEEALKK